MLSATLFNLNLATQRQTISISARRCLSLYLSTVNLFLTRNNLANVILANLFLFQECAWNRGAELVEAVFHLGRLRLDQSQGQQRQQKQGKLHALRLFESDNSQEHLLFLMFDTTFFEANVWHQLILSFLLAQVYFVYQTIECRKQSISLYF